MNIEEAIKGRRSVRKYSEKEITKETLDSIVEIARFAPSWKNSQTARYHIVLDKEVKQRISKNCVIGFEHNSKIIDACQALVVVTGVSGLCGYEKDGTYTTSKGDSWEMFDAGIASQTFCLAAYSLGVGSVILGIFDEDRIKKEISIPDGENVKALIALGYQPQDVLSNAPKRKDVKELVSYI